MNNNMFIHTNKENKKTQTKIHVSCLKLGTAHYKFWYIVSVSVYRSMLPLQLVITRFTKNSLAKNFLKQGPRDGIFVRFKGKECQ